MKGNKKGTAMVEATLIFPIIIIVVIGLIHINMALYQLVEENCMNHTVLLEEENEKMMIGEFIRRIDLMKGLIE